MCHFVARRFADKAVPIFSTNVKKRGITSSQNTAAADSRRERTERLLGVATPPQFVAFGFWLTIVRDDLPTRHQFSRDESQLHHAVDWVQP